jgi:hypothetical protein
MDEAAFSDGGGPRQFFMLVQHRLEVPRQQCLDLLHGAGRGQMLEQIVQVRVGLVNGKSATH